MPKGQKPKQPYGTMGDAKYNNMVRNKSNIDPEFETQSSGRYGPLVDTKKEYDGYQKWGKWQADADNEPSRAGRIDGDAGVSTSGPKPRKGLTSQSRAKSSVDTGKNDHKFFKHVEKDN